MAETGCCGMNCEACGARRATLAHNNVMLAKIAAKEENGGRGFVLPFRLRCTGCTAPGIKSIHCAECAIRECALSNHMPHCGFCPDYPCELGAPFWEAVPEYKHNLDVLKSR